MDQVPTSDEGKEHKGSEGDSTSYQFDLHIAAPTPEAVINTLKSVILPMLRGGVEHDDNHSSVNDADFHYLLRPEFAAGVYLDGEGMLVAVNPDGEILGLVRPDGTEDETAQQIRMSAMEWSETHEGLERVQDLAGEGRGPTKEQSAALAARLLLMTPGLIPEWLDKGQGDKE